MPNEGASSFYQQAFFDDSATRRAPLPVLGEQKDIRYYGIQAKGILNSPEVTGMDYWSINPYIGCAFGCAYCYARYAHGYALDRAATANPDHPTLGTDLRSLPSWLAFERRILVKENAPARLAQTLRTGSTRLGALAQGAIAIGTATDPYQPAERRYRVTRGILETLANHPGLSISVTTKSPLVTRDIDVLTRIARHSAVRIHLSLITIDRELARRIEPRAPTPESRVRAIRRLREAGLDVGVNVMPVLPGITDGKAQLESLVAAVAEAGATHLGACALRLQSSARKRYLPFIDAEFPELSQRYRATYATDHHATQQYRDGLATVVRRLCERHGVTFGYRSQDGLDRMNDDSGEQVDQLALPLER